MHHSGREHSLLCYERNNETDESAVLHWTIVSNVGDVSKDVLEALFVHNKPTES